MILSWSTDSAQDHYNHKWHEMIQRHAYMQYIDIENTNTPRANIGMTQYVMVPAYQTQQSHPNPMSTATILGNIHQWTIYWDQQHYVLHKASDIITAIFSMMK